MLNVVLLVNPKITLIKSGNLIKKTVAQFKLSNTIVIDCQKNIPSLRQLIKRHGKIDKITGDFVMVIFLF